MLDGDVDGRIFASEVVLPKATFAMGLVVMATFGSDGTERLLLMVVIDVDAIPVSTVQEFDKRRRSSTVRVLSACKEADLLRRCVEVEAGGLRDVLDDSVKDKLSLLALLGLRLMVPALLCMVGDRVNVDLDPC